MSDIAIKIAGVITIFNSDVDGFAKVVNAIVHQCPKVTVVDNGSSNLGEVA
jgi:hypothetical protein